MRESRHVLPTGNRILVCLVLTSALWLGSGITSATVQFLDDGAVRLGTGWDLPPQGTCPADLTKATRAACLALRYQDYTADGTAAGQCRDAAAGGANRSWSTGSCNDLINNTSQAVCEAQGDRLWTPATATKPAVCAVVMLDDDRNDITCVRHGGTWITAGTCTGNWIMPARTAYTPNLLTGNSPGDQCLRCHNTSTQYNSPRVRDTEDTLYMGHKNMARKVIPGQPWGGPPIACTVPAYTDEEDCIHNGGKWLPIDPYPSDDSGNTFNWSAGQITVGGTPFDLTWIYGDWLAPLPRAIYKAPASTSKTCTDPRYSTQTTCESNGGSWVFNAGASYSCARCHTTGWTSDAAIKNAAGIEGKEPEASFPGLSWDRNGNAPANVVNLSGGVTGDPNKYGSWDAYGIVCTRCHSSAVDTTNVVAGSSPPQYNAPAGMSSHHSNLTATDISPGACTDSRFTAETQCTQNGGTWMTACSLASTAAVCTNAATTQTACGTSPSGTWVPAPGFCSNAYYADQTSCTSNGTCSNAIYPTQALCTSNSGTWSAFTWQDGWCQRADLTTQGACTGGTGANALTWRLNGTQASCQIAGGAWSFTKCSTGHEGVCNKGTCSDPADTNQVNCEAHGGTWTGNNTLTACTTAGGQFRYVTDVIRCEDAGGEWTGNNSNRGQIITALCMNCHRQETGGLPYNATSTDGVNVDYTATDPAGQLKVGPYHSTVTFLSHPHGPQFLNSPHAEFTGKFNEIATGRFGSVYNSFFIAEGETANTGNGCTGCHEIHTSTVTGEKPFRAECKSCHTGAFDVDLTKIRHLKGPGTPLEKMATEPSEPCIVCHMPEGKHLFRINADPAYSTFPIPAAFTATVNANTAPDGTYTKAVWVDIDAACGQCHGGGTAHAETTGSISAGSKVLTVASTTGFLANERIAIADAGIFRYDDQGPVHGDFESYIVSVVPPTTINLVGTAPFGVSGKAVVQNETHNGAAYYKKADLAQVARGMHESAGVNYPVSFTAARVAGSLTVNVDASVDCGGSCPPLDYAWSWGDGSTGSGDPASHTYASAGSFTISLTAKLTSNSQVVGTSNRSVTLTAPDLPPAASSTCTWDPTTWTMTVTDTSTDDGPDADTLGGDGDAAIRAFVNWGDGSAKTVLKHTPGPASGSHTYVRAGTFSVTGTVTDSKLQSASWTCSTQATPGKFLISGTVFKKGGTVPLQYATVKVRKGSTVIKTMYSAADGTFSSGAILKPGTYALKITKFGYTFPAATSITVGPNSSGNVVVATAP